MSSYLISFLLGLFVTSTWCSEKEKKFSEEVIYCNNGAEAGEAWSSIRHTIRSMPRSPLSVTFLTHSYFNISSSVKLLLKEWWKKMFHSGYSRVEKKETPAVVNLMFPLTPQKVARCYPLTRMIRTGQNSITSQWNVKILLKTRMGVTLCQCGLSQLFFSPAMVFFGDDVGCYWVARLIGNVKAGLCQNGLSRLLEKQTNDAFYDQVGWKSSMKRKGLICCRLSTY